MEKQEDEINGRRNCGRTS